MRVVEKMGVGTFHTPTTSLPAKEDEARKGETRAESRWSGIEASVGSQIINRMG